MHRAEADGRAIARAASAADDGAAADWRETRPTFEEFSDGPAGQAIDDFHEAAATRAAEVRAMSENMGLVVREAIRRAMHQSARSEQSRDRRLGPSEIGGCRAYLARIIGEVPFDDDYAEDPKWQAFIGSAVGDMVEHELVTAEPDRYANQVPITARLPRLGVEISGHVDILEKNRKITDLKTKDGLALVRKTGAPLEHLIQINIYLLGAIQQGLVPEDAEWELVYLDRSGRDDEPFVVTGALDMSIIEQAEQRLEDAFYAAEYDMDTAPRDKPYDFCVSYCPFFTSCRGADEHQVSGLITDQKYLDAIHSYRDAMATIREAEKVKDEAKEILRGISGSTGEVEVSWTSVPATPIAASVRAEYDRISIRKVPKPKVARARKPRVVANPDAGWNPEELAGEDA